MVTTKLYLDCRATKNGKPAHLKLTLTREGKSTYIPMNVSLLPSQWDKRQCVVTNHPQKRQLNAFIAQRKVEIDTLILSLLSAGLLSGLRITEVKQKILNVINPKVEPKTDTLFAARYKAFADKKMSRTKAIYERTYKLVQSFSKKSFLTLRFEDITKDWLTSFNEFLIQEGQAQNTRFIHFRNIRAVFNDAIDNDITTNYPFRKFKFKAAPTRKRSFCIEQLRKVLLTEVNDSLKPYQDIFALTFLLIGINIIDLCHLTSIDEGRVSYIRAKTHKPYSIKVEPEAQAVISRNCGKNYLLYILDRYKTYRTYYTKLCNGLSDLRDYLNRIDDGIHINELTTYWARHSWATIARSIGISVDDIALSLGHGDGHDTTHIYLDEDLKMIDDANRRVIDWVYYSKK